jgi:hypothetical protein
VVCLMRVVALVTKVLYEFVRVVKAFYRFVIVVSAEFSLLENV